MTQLAPEMARDRHKELLAVAAEARELRRAKLYGRMVRQAERAERMAVSHACEAQRLRARLSELEASP